MFEGRAQAMVRERNAQATLAWRTAMFMRVEKLPRRPPLEKEPRTKRKPQSWQQMKAIALMWNAVHNGEVRTKH